jgi:lipoprotein-anchoring transpeptidase ErfK/SrfK
MRISARTLALLTMLGGLAVLTGCGSTGAANWHAPGDRVTTGGPATMAIAAPADGASDVPTSVEIGLTGAAADTTVTLADATGTAVEGALRPDRSAWLPAAQLTYGTTYTATLGGTGRKVTFTTMGRPGTLIRVGTPLTDGEVYGVGLPIVVELGADVAADQRANVERRLLVTSEPAQVGGWHWFNGSELHYRPRDYWQEGTRLSVRLATGGLPLGGNAYGARDVTIHATIGEKIVMSTDDTTHTMTVTRRDVAVRTIPVSLGKSSTPSSSGSMVVMTKNQSELFVSTAPGDSYRETVYWTQRLTWGGEYIHAAPWSVGDQGRRNVSHGCTNVSTEQARWLFGITHVGDPVIVKGTPRKLKWGNGWSDWDRPWEEYVKGSALPAPATTG